MDLLSYFRVLRRRWLIIVVCVLVGAALGVASTLFDTKEAKTRTYYKATNTQIFDSSSSSSVPSVVNNIDQVAVLVTSGSVPDDVAKALGTEEIGRQLAEKIVTTTNSVTTTVDITAVDPNAQRATELADEFAKQIAASLVTRDTARYNAARDDLQKQLGDLKNTANGFLAQLAQSPRIPDFDTVAKQYDATQNQYYDVYGQLQALTSAGAPTSRLSTLQTAQSVPIPEAEYRARLNLGALGQNHLRADAQGSTADATQQLVAAPGPSLFASKRSRGLLGAFLGLLIGIGVAFFADRLDKRIRTRAEAEDAFGLPVLAEVPVLSRSQAKMRELVAFSQPQSRAADGFRAIRTSLLFQRSSMLAGASAGPMPAVDGLDDAGRQHEPLVIMVTSASPREGKTTTSANLAAVFAEAGDDVLIVNCDFRRPTVHQHFGVDDLPRTVQATSVPHLKIVTNVLSDPAANPAQIVAAQRQVVTAARQRFPVIILDTAPMLTANDAIETAGVASLVLFVARANVTTTDKAQRSMEILTRLEAPLGGVVLMASEAPTSDYYYYYQRGRGPGRGKQKRPYKSPDANSGANGAVNGSSSNGGSSNGSSMPYQPTGETQRP